MKNVILAILLTVGFSTTALADWRFEGIWEGYTFTAFERPGKDIQLIWDDQSPGFVGYYNAHPVPAVRCMCSTYDINSGGRRTLLVERPFRKPQGGWYRGIPFNIIGEPVEYLSR